jgi:hypothetical protein
MEKKEMSKMLWEYLPDEINIEKYRLDRIEKEENREKYAPFSWLKKIYLIENNIKPKWFENNKNIISKGFYDYKKLIEFPINFRRWIVYVKQRKWYDTKNKKVITTNNVEYKWSKAIDDLIFFCRHWLIPEK